MELLRVLILVKTYPIPSTKYDELVCTAGITDDGRFVRLYPINFRDLPPSQRYRKYQWIEVAAEHHRRNDVRKESYRPDCSTIKLLGEPIATRNSDWSERASFALTSKSQSLEELRELQDIDHRSLGVIRPKSINDLIIVPDNPRWKTSFEAANQQGRFWEQRTASRIMPRKLPFKFQYVFDCDDIRCRGHRMMIEDWEVGALYWRIVGQGYDAESAAQRVRDKFLSEVCAADRDTHFFVGTVSGHPRSWVIIGVFWPRIRKTDAVQLALQLA